MIVLPQHKTSHDTSEFPLEAAIHQTIPSISITEVILAIKSQNAFQTRKLAVQPLRILVLA